MVDSHSEAIVTATSVFLALSLVTVGLRCFVRARIVRAFGLDDWTMVAAMVGLFTAIDLVQQRTDE
jgi:hypothetical protein